MLCSDGDDGEGGSVEEEVGWMELKKGEQEEEEECGVWAGRCLTLERRLSFLPFSLHRPVSGAAVWHKSLHLPFCLKMQGRTELL